VRFGPLSRRTSPSRFFFIFRNSSNRGEKEIHRKARTYTFYCPPGITFARDSIPGWCLKRKVTDCRYSAWGNSFHEKAGQSQDGFVSLSVDLLLFSRAASVAILPPAVFYEEGSIEGANVLFHSRPGPPLALLLYSFETVPVEQQKN